MSTRFNGFTPDDIVTINSKTDLVKKPNSGTVRKHAAKKTNSDTKTNDKLAKSDAHKNIAVTSATSANDSSNLSESTIQTFQDALHFKPLSQQSSNNGTASKDYDSVPPCSNENNGLAITANHQNNNYIRENENGTPIGGRSTFEGISLKDFEKHQQVMKEANSEKRKLLSQVIEQRFEQSIAEATKIAKIREELDKLDLELATDVEILRKEIESVTLQYTATKENYHQIESQFLAAKLSLHQITEKKEMLTEHLCTIISHNEDRKAKKLSELLDKVGLPSDADSNENEIENDANL